MPAEPTRAVFLSYASQDAEAARRVCEALRSGGVEVWFDADGGLEHGDEWDAKIRRQIKECVLFIPVISANTQAREEGYFRIEWELAAQRAMGIASGVPFILPVVIDDTREPEALVPDRFRMVQWTRLRGGEVPPEVQQRFLKLWSHRAGLLKHQAAQHDVEAGRPRSAGLGSPFGETLPDTTAPGQTGAGRMLRGRHWWVIGTVVLLLAAGIFWPKLRRTEAPTALNAPQPPAATEKPAANASPADALVARAYALIEKMNYTRDNLAIAEDLTRRATELATDSARAWAARAYMQACYILRGWDTGEKRRQDTQAYAQRALALDPNAVEALLASGYLLNSQQAYAQAEVVLRRAIALRPDDPRAHRSLTLAVGRQGREDEAITMGQEIVRLFPRDSLAHYGLAGGYLARADFAAALASYEAAIAVEPFAGALLAKATLQAAWRGDLAAARATLGQLAPEDRTEDRAVGVAMWLGLLERQPAQVHAAAALTARTYLDDSLLLARGPKAAGTALAYHLDQKEGLARQHWQAAEVVLRQRLRDRPETSADHARLATVLAWLGRTEEAMREIAAFEALAQEQPAVSNATLLARFYATTGDAARAVPYLRQALNRHHAITDALLPIDPWWDKLRSQPGFTALLGETKPRAAAPAPATAPAAAISPARELGEKARSLLLGLEATREDFALAEEYCRRALKLDSTDADVCATYAQLNAAFVYRGWEATSERKEQCRVWAERAIRLAPRSPLARLAQAGAWSTLNINRAETEKLLRELVAEQPNDQSVLRFLASVVLSRGGLVECLALGERSAALPGGDPLALYNNARILWQRGQQARAYDILLRALAQKPFSSALVLKASMEIHWRGDLAAAEAALKEIPASALLEDRANFTIGLVHYYQRRADAALKAWGAFPREFYNDFHYDGPKGLLLGLAYEVDRRDAAARTEWRTALQAVEKRLVTAANQPALHFQRAYLLACLGEKSSAEEALRTHEELAGLKLTPGSRLPSDLAIVYLRLGRWDEVLAHPPPSFTRLRLDPRFDSARKDARFEKLLELVSSGSAKPTP